MGPGSGRRSDVEMTDRAREASRGRCPGVSEHRAVAPGSRPASLGRHPWVFSGSVWTPSPVPRMDWRGGSASSAQTGGLSSAGELWNARKSDRWCGDTRWEGPARWTPTSGGGRPPNKAADPRRPWPPAGRTPLLPRWRRSGGLVSSEGGRACRGRRWTAREWLTGFQVHLLALASRREAPSWPPGRKEPPPPGEIGPAQRRGIGPREGGNSGTDWVRGEPPESPFCGGEWADPSPWIGGPAQKERFTGRAGTSRAVASLRRGSQVAECVLPTRGAFSLGGLARGAPVPLVGVDSLRLRPWSGPQVEKRETKRPLSDRVGICVRSDSRSAGWTGSGELGGATTLWWLDPPRFAARFRPERADFRSGAQGISTAGMKGRVRDHILLAPGGNPLMTCRWLGARSPGRDYPGGRLAGGAAGPGRGAAPVQLLEVRGTGCRPFRAGSPSAS